MHLHPFDYGLWLAQPLLQTVTLLVWQRRHLYRPFPMFTLYLVLQIVSTVALALLLRHSYDDYFVGYWMVAFASLCVAFALTRELFVAAFAFHAPSSLYARPLLRWMLAIIAVVVLVVVLSLANRELLHDPFPAILLADRVARIAFLALILLLMMSSPILGVRPRHILFGIALGFAVFTPIRLAFDILVTWPGFGGNLRRLNSLAYTVSCLIWLAWAVWGDCWVPAPLGATQRVATGPDHPASRGGITSLDDMVARTMQPPDQDS